jgi:hypothetical protein
LPFLRDPSEWVFPSPPLPSPQVKAETDAVFDVLSFPIFVIPGIGQIQKPGDSDCSCRLILATLWTKLLCFNEMLCMVMVVVVATEVSNIGVGNVMYL